MPHAFLPVRSVMLSVAAFVALLGLNSPRTEAAEPDKDGWVTLLKGTDFSENWTTKGNWKPGTDEDVQLEPRPGESGWQRYDAYLWSKEQYKDFEIDIEFKVAKGSNSGFYFHVGDLKEPVATGVEVQIYDSHSKGPDGALNDHDCGGIIPGVPPTKNAAKPPGEWNRFLITSQGDKVIVKLNGEAVNEVDLSKGALGSRPKSGYIGFQDHGLPLSVRNIRIRKL
jgi:hypothetical protein